ncbi:unnamed protein product [Linum tenue]|uniref:Ubiquitin fusion degradation protein UFD1 N-terminal subdomain 1 domain-containing protein n=1 Tax=Linum tenue TaxID=586396 RepID=A0AAV0H6V6_9ROSI|nr:unnamed protein product [Linum tenue]
MVHHEAASETNQKETHSGALEFTAEEGQVGLPPHVWSNLFPLDNTPSPATALVVVRYVWLPKGIYAKLQPDMVSKPVTNKWREIDSSGFNTIRLSTSLKRKKLEEQLGSSEI